MLLTTQSPVGGLPGYGENVNEVGRLPDICSARLFTQLYPHQGRSRKTIPRTKTAYAVLAQQPIISRLNGNPRRIMNFAYQCKPEIFEGLVFAVWETLQRIRDKREMEKREAQQALNSARTQTDASKKE